MKAVVLAGGLGTRFAEETVVRPKALVEIGGRPILWHVMKTYSHYGINDFVICLGYKGHLVKEYFAHYVMHHADVTIDLRTDQVTVHRGAAEPWRVTLVDTGERTMTGGRLKRAASYLQDDAEFCLTYADGVCNVDVRRLVAFHRESGATATVTAIQTPGRFGRVILEGNSVMRFEEKPQHDGGWINAGYFVLSRRVLEYIDGDATIWEREPIESLVREGRLSAFRHTGFWGCMDTLQDRQALEALWNKGNAPWKVW
jgi:glucose-1-phosphate cytidylyltransferase